MAQSASESLEERIAKRSPVLQSIADALVSEDILPGSRILLRPALIPLVTSAYFILNGAYKDWRIEDKHRTEAPKIAALQCMAIMTIPPFRPLYPNNVTSIAEARCNEIYALACASAVIGKDIAARGCEDNFYLRLLDVISASRSQTLEPYVVDVEYQIDVLWEHGGKVNDVREVGALRASMRCFEDVVNAVARITW